MAKPKQPPPHAPPPPPPPPPPPVEGKPKPPPHAPPPPPEAKKSFMRRMFPFLLAANVFVGAYMLMRTYQKDSGKKDTESDPTSATPTSSPAAAEKPAEPIVAPIKVLTPISQDDQRQLYKWMLEEKRKIKPRDAAEKKKINEEKALLKEKGGLTGFGPLTNPRTLPPRSSSLGLGSSLVSSVLFSPPTPIDPPRIPPLLTAGELPAAAEMATRYWIVSLPVQTPGSTANSLWARLQDSISRHSFDTPLYRFNVPDLRVGTLDSLLALSDDLVKSNVFIEGVSHKIRRQIEELERAGGVESGALTVDGVPVDTYLTRFVWDEGKYPTMSPLKEIVGSIQSQVSKIEDDMKVRGAEYNNVRSQLSAINRKQTGSLAVRDLSNLVKPEDMVTSEHLVTLLAVVPKYSQKDWLSSYESLDTFVVPRSSKKLYEDNEYALYTVTLFAKVVDNFKVRAREKGFQVRDFEYSSEAQESRKEELEKLMQDQEAMRASLLQWCYASYSEVFSSWMHFCAVRVFVESILRYGLPPSFLSAVLAPSQKGEKKVRSILEELCGNVHSIYWKSEDDVGVAGLGGETEAHPYVSFTINFV
uniref:V-type proton ATPase subunit C n=1 Tax=Oryza meridionalis TaxID=40149 RepID=A0A0E0DV75_9ORYZ